MKLLLLFLCLTAAAFAGSNPADYDPYHDNDHDTYHLVAAVIPDLPQEEETGEWHQPPAGPNAEQCGEVWDKGVPCPVDGKFYGYWGELQPEFCDHDFFQKDGKTQKPDKEKCRCNVAMIADQKDCPGDGPMIVEGATCNVYCREMTNCKCVNICDMHGNAGDTPEPVAGPKTKPTKKKGAK